MEKYRRVGILGHGACSKVFLVQDSETGENYVVKQIEAPLSGQQRDSALREAALLRVLHHPHIVGYREAFVTRSGFICLIMEYAHGGDMHQLVQQRAPARAWLQETQVHAWLAQLCDALRYLHERNVIHRDIKARNIFLKRTGEAQLGDFGISTVVDSPDEQLNCAIGTPSYASPERMRKWPYGSSADIWSLGVVFYEVCALRKPFEGDTLLALAERIISGQYEPLDERLYSSELRTVISRMMAYAPEDRPTAGGICDLPFVQPAESHAARHSLPPLVVPHHVQNKSHLHPSANHLPPNVEDLAMANSDLRPESAGAESAISTEGMETLLLSPHPAPPYRAGTPDLYPKTASPAPLAVHTAGPGFFGEPQVIEVEVLDMEVRSNATQHSQQCPKAAWQLDRRKERHDPQPHQSGSYHGGFGHALIHGARRLLGLEGSNQPRPM